jgi:integrase
VAQLAELPAGAKTRKSKAMAADQVAALLALDLTPWWRAYIATAVMTGLRPGELLGLRWQDVDTRAGVIRVRVAAKRVKGRLVLADLKTEQSRRTLKMPAAVAEALAAQKRAQAEGRLGAGGGVAGSRPDLRRGQQVAAVTGVTPPLTCTLMSRRPYPKVMLPLGATAASLALVSPPGSRRPTP